MPEVRFATSDLKRFGHRWQANGGSLTKAQPESSLQFGNLIDSTVANSLATMLGGIPVVQSTLPSLASLSTNSVETGLVRIVGGVRPQNFDVVYRPDGVRFAFDSKTLNDTKSVKKNYQNMINDLASEATTVHSRFPFALVAFMVVIPEPCLIQTARVTLIETLDRLGRRRGVDDLLHLAEAVALVLWDPTTGEISKEPSAGHLRIERFAEIVQTIYVERYKGLPPHVTSEEDDVAHD